MKKELPSWAAPVIIAVAVIIVAGVIWASVGAAPKKVDPSSLGPIPAPSAPPTTQ